MRVLMMRIIYPFFLCSFVFPWPVRHVMIISHTGQPARFASIDRDSRTTPAPASSLLEDTVLERVATSRKKSQPKADLASDGASLSAASSQVSPDRISTLRNKLAGDSARTTQHRRSISLEKDPITGPAPSNASSSLNVSPGDEHKYSPSDAPSTPSTSPSRLTPSILGKPRVRKVVSTFGTSDRFKDAKADHRALGAEIVIGARNRAKKNHVCSHDIEITTRLFSRMSVQSKTRCLQPKNQAAPVDEQTQLIQQMDMFGPPNDGSPEENNATAEERRISFDVSCEFEMCPNLTCFQCPADEFVATTMQMSLIGASRYSPSVSRTFIIHGTPNVDILAKVVHIYHHTSIK